MMKLWICICLSGLLLLSGCPAAAIVIYKLTPPPTTPAKFKLKPDIEKPAGDMTAVLVENGRNPGGNEIDAVHIASLLRQDLRQFKSANLIDDDAVLRLRDKDTKAFRKMPITEIGQQVGAAQVVYVDIQRVTVDIDTAGQMVRGQMEVFVKVVDTRTGANRWPLDMQQGFPVGFESQFQEITARMTEFDVRRGMYEKLVLEIGRLFRDWVPETDHLTNPPAGSQQ